jgi:hypothetical protein
MLDAADVAHQLREKRVVPRSWRPTYCTVRLQTTDGGAPIAPHTVMVEMGHRSLSMINKIYNRLGASRPKRRPFVEYWRPDARFPGEERSGRSWGRSAWMRCCARPRRRLRRRRARPHRRFAW